MLARQSKRAGAWKTAVAVFDQERVFMGVRFRAAENIHFSGSTTLPLSSRGPIRISGGKV